MNIRTRRAIGLGCALAALTAAPAAGAATSTATFDRDAAGPVTVVRSATGAVSTATGRITAATLGVRNAAPAQLARAAVDRYAGMLGLSGTLRQHAAASDAHGTTVTYEQLRGGVPVFDGRVRVHVMPGAAAVSAITASLAPANGTPATAAAVTADRARAIAVDGVDAPDVLSGPRLVVYAGVPFGARPATLAWVTDVRSTVAPVRDLVVVDAVSGRVVDRLDRIADARDRRIYDLQGRTSGSAKLVLSEGGSLTADADANNAYINTGKVYDYYASTFGRDSYDNAGSPLLSFVNYGVNYRNAFWDGAEMVYGDGYPVDDVTGHELTHAVTENTAALEYSGQPGALNESLSDMAGWDVDPGDTTMGEDLPGGAIRDMANPGAYGQPATASGYVCTSSDSGGVHTNSGIPNKAYANMVSSIGRAAAEQVRYRAQVDYLTPQATFADARAAFEAAAADLGVSSAAVGQAWAAQGVTSSWQPSC